MRIMPLALFVSASASLLAAPAFADKTSVITYGGVYTSYPYQDLGVNGSSRPVTQDGITFTNGPWQLDNWVSLGNTGGGNQGAVEVDETVHYNRTFDFKSVGPIQTELTGAYYFFNSEGLNKIHDDVVDLHADFSRPFKVGSTTVTPFFRYTRIQWIAQSGYLDFVQPGVRLSMPLSSRWSMSAEGSPSYNATRGINTWRFQGDLNFDAGHGLTLGLRAKLTDRVKPMIGVDFSKSL